MVSYKPDLHARNAGLAKREVSGWFSDHIWRPMRDHAIKWTIGGTKHVLHATCGIFHKGCDKYVQTAAADEIIDHMSDEQFDQFYETVKELKDAGVLRKRDWRLWDHLKAMTHWAEGGWDILTCSNFDHGCGDLAEDKWKMAEDERKGLYEDHYRKRDTEDGLDGKDPEDRLEEQLLELQAEMVAVGGMEVCPADAVACNAVAVKYMEALEQLQDQ